MASGGSALRRLNELRNGTHVIQDLPMLVEPREVRLCQPKTIIVSAGFNALQDQYGGTVSLNTRIDGVIAYRVKYFNITLDPADGDVNVNGTLFALRSMRLSSNSTHNKFVSAVSTAPSTLQSAVDDSTIIGWSSVSGVSISLASPAQQQQCNHLQSLGRAQAIEGFDWNIIPLAAPISPVNHPYRIEFVIEFYQECQCQNRVIDVYGSS